MSDASDLGPARVRHKRHQPGAATSVQPDQGETADPEVAATDVEAMLRREAPGLLRYLRRQVRDDADAADLLSEVFVVAWRRNSDMPRPTQQARMWLFGVARRTAATHRRGVTRRSQLVERLRGELSAHTERAAADGGRFVSDDSEVEGVRVAMSRLRPADREILAVVHWDGFSLVEAAAILGIRPGTARTRYQRARARMAQALEACPGQSSG